MAGADAWEKYAERFWFLRGVAAAIAIAQLVPAFMDLSRFEFLRAFHAVLVGWNEVAEFVGRAIGTLPFIPELSAQAVNAFFFTLALGLPTAYHSFLIVLAMKEEQYGMGRSWSWLGLLHPTETLSSSRLVLDPGAHGHPIVQVIWAAGAGLAVLVLTGATYLLLIGEPLPPARLMVALILNPVPLILLLSFFSAVSTLKGYGKGIVVVFSFVATLQILYWLNTPWLAEQINAMARTTLLRAQ